jgi:hypothetical protein
MLSSRISRRSTATFSFAQACEPGPCMKIFGIGFHKTGTKSLAQALSLLGYSVTGPNGTRDPDIGTKVFEYVEKLTPRFDAFQDNPWPMIFRELDGRFPDSKFILTMRNPADWIRSVVDHFGCEDTPMRQWIYGIGHPQGNEEVYLRRYEEHNRSVLAHFRDRSDRLLVMDITSGDSWEKLCPFLGRKHPQVAFPIANTALERRKPTGVS